MATAQPSLRRILSSIHIDLVVGASLLTLFFVIFWWSPVQQVTDSNYSLLLSENLLVHHTFALENYAIPRYAPFWQDYAYKNGEIYHLEWVRDRLYYFFPPGSSILSVPFVGLMRLAGLSPSNPDGTYNPQGEMAMEALLAAILMAFAGTVFYFTSRLFLPVRISVLIAVGAALGTQVWSTASRALWSDTWGIVLLSVVAYLLLATESNKRSFQPILIATLLAWSYFVKPTANLPIFGITVYVAIKHRRRLLPFLITGVVWFGGFIAYSYYNYRTVLPNYYLARRLSFTIFFESLAGHLISPSRGLFIYVPVIGFVIWMLVRYRKNIKERSLLWLSVFAVGSHLIVISGFDHWWGGFCYGPRLLASLIPWFVLLSILALKAMLDSGNNRPRWSQTALGLVLLAVSIFANARGALAESTWIWNTVPTNVDLQPDRLWSWRETQMLAGLIRPPQPRVYPPLEGTLKLSSEESFKYLWYGWSGAEGDHRWTDGREASIVFTLRTISDKNLKLKLMPYLAEGKHQQQRVEITLNGTTLRLLVLTSTQPSVHNLEVPANLFKERNLLIMGLPDAISPSEVEGKEDWRRLGVAVWWIAFENADAVMQ